jgi:hypothetical protein
VIVFSPGPMDEADERPFRHAEQRAAWLRSRLTVCTRATAARVLAPCPFISSQQPSLSSSSLCGAQAIRIVVYDVLQSSLCTLGIIKASTKAAMANNPIPIKPAAIRNSSTARPYNARSRLT